MVDTISDLMDMVWLEMVIHQNTRLNKFIYLYLI